ncbi:MAG: COX15/CtaA family protein [Actinomycetota bacterium]|nr:COX15/CtaA family protein [Actinomycetota bacterium]
MQRTLTPATYVRVTRLALWSLVVIVVTGAAVRLSGSGLGCSDWPTCTSERFVPEREFHGLVEFINRMFTGAVSMAVIAAVLASQLRATKRKDLTRLSWGLVVGVVAQIVLGGVTVLTHLRPEIVMAHFLLSMVLVANAVLLQHRAGTPDEVIAGRASKRSSHDRTWAMRLMVLSSITVVLGTVVTAAGPHAGDEEVERLSVDLGWVARIHGASVWLLLAAIVWFAYIRSRFDTTPHRPTTVRLEQFVLVVLAQGTIGYVQYFNDTPALLVGLHIVGACTVWISVLRLVLFADDAAADNRDLQELQRT